MVTRVAVESFLGERRLALVGASRGGKSFGNTILRELRSKGYDVVPVHPDAAEIDGVRAAETITAVDPRPGGVVVCVPADRGFAVIEEAAASGIRRVWLQQGAESDDLVARCAALGLDCVHGECILMFAEPAAWIHRVHRWVNGVRGRLPA